MGYKRAALGSVDEHKLARNLNPDVLKTSLGNGKIRALTILR